MLVVDAVVVRVVSVDVGNGLRVVVVVVSESEDVVIESAGTASRLI
jgi:hypothetical protein